ncbi:MAG: cytochrome c [Halieaceae bacterium]|jgi:cytochrome c553|nr:cytochrome c [Halieaceae bacterium]
MTKMLFILTLIFCTSAQVKAADADAGKALYATCAACHGASGEGIAAMNSPALTGQSEAYIVRQLSNFRSGIRGADASDVTGMQMRGMAATLVDDSAITNVSAYIASLPAAVSTEDTTGANLRNGENQYVAACGACHGGVAQGNDSLNAPRLAGLGAVYLKRQYQNFAAGIRGSHPDDRLGQQMKMMASMLASEKDLDDVIAFIGSR